MTCSAEQQVRLKQMLLEVLNAILIFRNIGSTNAFPRSSRFLSTSADLSLNQAKANVFDPKHLEGVSTDLVQSMFQVVRKAAQLERAKLQKEIRKEQSEIRRKTLEKRIKMASSGRKGGPVKNPKREVEEDEDVLEDLVVEPKKDPKKGTSYSSLKPGGFIMKATDHGGRLSSRQTRIAAAKEQEDDDDDDNEEEMEKEQLERETRELQSELHKTEKAVEKARDQEEKEKARRFSKRIQSGIFLKQPQAVSLVPQKKKRKTLKTEPIKSADELDEEDEIPEGFHLQEESPHCINMTRSEDYQAYLRQLVVEYE